MTSSYSTEICYLCGLPLEGQIDRDHVPMKQLYGKEFRKTENPDLFKLPTHRSCNRSFQKDEDYFVYSFIPVARDSLAGNMVADDVAKRAKSGEQIPLLHKVFKQYTESRIDSIGNMRLVEMDGTRVWRVIWKIVKGLYYRENGKYLIDNVPRRESLYGPDDQFSDIIKEFIKEKPSRADYPRVFDYRYITIAELHNAHYFLLAFWETVVFEVLFHDPNCSCEVCVKFVS